jgi:uncharacterized membrane protein
VPIQAFRQTGGLYNPAMDLARLIIIAVLIAIIGSLGSALFQLSRGTGDSQKMLRALTWRISLSVALFIVLLIAWRMGLIHPHGMQ